MNYDSNNIFAKILRGDIPNKTVYEDDRVLAFHDIAPKRKIHVVVIPKSAHTDMSDFCEHAADEDIIALMRAVPKVAKAAGLSEGGYRVISNCGTHSGQEVPHLHLHLLGGEIVGALVD